MIELSAAERHLLVGAIGTLTPCILEVVDAHTADCPIVQELEFLLGVVGSNLEWLRATHEMALELLKMEEELGG